MFRTLMTLILTLLTLAGCGGTYVTETIPPVIELRNYKTVAVVDFSVTDRYYSKNEVTHRFLATVQGAQPGVKFLELGSEQQVLRSIGRQTMDIEAIKMIGQKYAADAVLTGEMVVTTLQPSLSLNNALTQLSASAKMKGALNGKVRETANGVTAWSNGAHGTWKLGGFSMNAQGLTSGGMKDLGSKNEEMLTDLINVATRDFRQTYNRRKID